MHLRGLVFALLIGCAGCGGNQTQASDQFVSQTFDFELSVPEDMALGGWLIVRAQDATVSHIYIPPDSSEVEPVAVVLPPGSVFPALAPFFVDVFRLKTPGTTVTQLGDFRATQVGTTLVERTPGLTNGVPSEFMVHRSPNTSDILIYEAFWAKDGLGYAMNTSGASVNAQQATQFFISDQAFRNVMATFRLRE